MEVAMTEPRRPPSPPAGGWKRKKKHPERRFRLSGVDLGDGKPLNVWLVVGPDGIVVRRVGSWRKWHVSLREGAEACARAAQRRMVEVRMGVRRGEAAPQA